MTGSSAIEKAGQDWVDRCAKLGLNYENRIHSAAAFALNQCRFLHDPVRKRKTVARDHEARLNETMSAAKTLAQHLQLIKREHLEHLVLGLQIRHGIKITSPELSHLMLAIVDVFQIVQEKYVKPIPNGVYNHFIFFYADGLVRDITIGFLVLTFETDDVRAAYEKWFYTQWEEIRKEAIDVACRAIVAEFSPKEEWLDIESVRRTVSNNIDAIIEERFQAATELAIKRAGNNS